MGIVFSEEEEIIVESDTDTIMESESEPEEVVVEEKQVPPKSPIVPPRNSVGYANLAEKLKQLREEMELSEFIMVDEAKEVEEEIISANI